MNDRIDWGDGSFEFVTQQELDNMNVKQYRNTHPFALCKYCVKKNCELHRSVAEQAAEIVFNKYFEESSGDTSYLFLKLKDIAAELKRTLDKAGNESVYICAFIQLLQMIDEETMIDITDEVAKKLYIAFSVEIG